MSPFIEVKKAVELKAFEPNAVVVAVPPLEADKGLVRVRVVKVGEVDAVMVIAPEVALKVRRLFAVEREETYTVGIAVEV